MTRKSGKHLHVTYGTLNSCFDLIGSHQQWTPWSPPQYAEAETLLLGHRFMPHISDAELTSYGDNARPLDLMRLEGTYSLRRTRPSPGLRLPKSVLWIHITLTSWAGNRIILYLNGGINVIYIYKRTHTHTHTHIYIYIYYRMRIYVCAFPQ